MLDSEWTLTSHTFRLKEEHYYSSALPNTIRDTTTNNVSTINTLFNTLHPSDGRGAYLGFMDHLEAGGPNNVKSPSSTIDGCETLL